jgi:dihydroorotase
LETARKLAGQFGIPVMVHIGDADRQVSPTLTREALPLLEPGDILSHVYTAKFGGVLQQDGTVLPELKEAMERGVILDTALGKTNFDFEVARRCMAQGILPTTLSTDLTAGSLTEGVYGMTVTMSKFMALGLDLKQVVEMSTANPACAMGEENRIGSLAPGMEADISILKLKTGKWRMADAAQQTIEVDRLITPVTTVKAGQPITAQPPARPEPVN